jgi:hypothetical protein
MNKKFISYALVLLLVNLACFSTARAETKLESKLVSKIKAGVIALGTGPQSKVKVKLFDGRKIKGYIQEITEDGFTVAGGDSNNTTHVLYPEVKQVKGKNHLSGKTIVIGVAIAVIILLGILIANSDGV